MGITEFQQTLDNRQFERFALRESDVQAGQSAEENHHSIGLAVGRRVGHSAASKSPEGGR